MALSLKVVVEKHLHYISCKDLRESLETNTAEQECTKGLVDHIPRPYASVHVRYGNKVAEQPSKPLERYTNMLKRKAGHVKNIFISTETEWVIYALAKNNPDYNFFFLDYNRVEQMDLQVIDPSIDYVHELVYSFANLYVAVEADSFVGSLTSSWCVLIHQMERTRGDGGADYLSVDLGSQYTSCF